MRYVFACLFCVIAAFAAVTVWAACSSPSGSEGTVIYNTDYNVIQYCNGTNWMNTAFKDAAATGTSCSSPTGNEGDVVYDELDDVLAFCNGDEWRNMACAAASDGGTGGCSSPTGVRGDLVYNGTVKRLQFCDGDEWVNTGRACTESATTCSGLGTTWTGKSAGNQAIQKLVINNDATIIATAAYSSYPYSGLSTDSGASYSTIYAGVPTVKDFDMSNDGTTFMVAGGTSNKVRTSTDSGATFANLGGYFSYTYDWSGVAITADGATMYATYGSSSAGKLYKSTDSGANWTSLPLGTLRFTNDVDVSDNGKYVYLVDDKNVKYSSDYGSTFSDAADLPSRIQFLSASGNGKIIYATITYDNYIYVSKDYGATWSAITALPAKRWLKTGVSYDGKTATFIESGGSIVYLTQDAGATVSTIANISPDTYVSTAVSGDGTVVLAAKASNTYVWSTTCSE